MDAVSRSALVLKRLSIAALILLVTSCGATSRSSHGASELAWSEWNPEAFERARRENRPILLSVQAHWCHWCHVMNDTTFRDPEVRRILRERFVLIQADGDARPDLAERYRRYAWPATVFLTPDGDQILGLRGYRSPDRFLAILGDVARAHQEGRSLDEDAGAAEAPAEDLAALRTSLIDQLDGFYDEEGGGWGQRQRYPFARPVEHAFYRASVRGETLWRERALFSLERYATLIDPVWGGMYQYSIPNVWTRPHYEKIAAVQAGALRAFSEAYRVTGDERWLTHAEAIRSYVREHLRSPDGAFYVAQDADLESGDVRVRGDEYYALDDAGRRALGIPRVDTHVYAATNGRLAEAFVELHIASGGRTPLAEATRAMEQILRTHRRPNGLFAHDAESADPVLYLNDQVHVLGAFLALHRATGQARWRDEARTLVDAMVEELGAEGFALHTADPRATGFYEGALVPITDNALAARHLLVLARLLDENRYREIAVASLRATARRTELRRMGRMMGEYLLALETLEDGHLLLSVVGPEDPRTAALQRAALDFYEPTRLVELGRPGASRYPYPGEPAIFLCTHQACSMPVFDPAELAPSVNLFLER